MLARTKNVRKFTHRQRLETKKSFKGLSILLARGEQHTTLHKSSPASGCLPLPFIWWHTYNLLLAFMCRDLGYIMSMQSSAYLGSVKITIRVETTFLFKTQFSLSPLSSLWGFDIWWPLWPWHLYSDNKQTFQTSSSTGINHHIFLHC